MNKTKVIEQETKYMRQSGFISSECYESKINIIGAGATGSFAALTLAKMGLHNITVYDDDLVELHNLPNQFYRESDVGKPKVVALKEIIQAFTGTTIDVHNEKYDAQILKGITISGLDNMTARENIWRMRIKFNQDIPLYIDARMGGEVMLVLAIRPTDLEDIEYYETTLYPEKEVAQIRCTQQAIIYTLLHLSGYISNTVKKFVMQEPYRKVTVFDTKTNSSL